MAIAKLKIGDKVRIIAGSCKGKEGEIIAVNREKNTVTVKGQNMMTKHQKAGRGKEAGIIEAEAQRSALLRATSDPPCRGNGRTQSSRCASLTPYPGQSGTTVPPHS